jgi:P-type Cu+ transporter
MDSRPSPALSVEEQGTGLGRRDRLRLFVVAAVALLTFLTLYLGVGHPYTPALFVEAVAVATTLGGGLPVFVETYHAVRHGRINMEASMALAIFASLAILQFTAAVVITFFVLLSEYIEAYAVDRGRSTLMALERSAPKRALVRRDGREVEVDPASLQIGDIVVVRQGERIPVDGEVILGAASVNQAPITGESTPVDKQVGDSVFSGAVVEDGTIEVRTEKVGRETVFGKIIQLMEEAEGKRAPILKVSDRLAALLIEAAIGFALIAFVLTRDVTSTISVIVVAGACGVAAGTPLAIVATMGKAAKEGVVVKGGIYVEQMSHVDTVVIDKTGTLTLGEARVAAVVPFGGRSANEVLEAASRVERHSTHPLARAILAKAREAGLGQPAGLDSSVNGSGIYLPGRGMVSGAGTQEVLVGNRRLMEERGARFPATAGSVDQAPGGGTVVFVASCNVVIGALQIADVVRPESRDAVLSLRRMGIRTVILTGDNRDAAEAVAKSVGVDEVYSDLLPQDKVAIVERLVGEGRKVAMVGDGINDAPALARADVGIGMGAGTDVAIEEADVVLMTNDLPKIADTLRLSRKAYRTIWSNFFGTVSVDTLGVGLAVIGILNPLSAAGIHVLSELIFIANSARLLR